MPNVFKLRLMRLVAVLGLLIAGGAVNAREGAPPLALESFDVVWSTIHDHHFDTNFNGVNWTGIKEPFRKRVAEAKSAHEAREVMQEMLELLDVSHLAIVSSDMPDAAEDDGGGGDLGQVQAVDEERSGTAGFEIRFSGDDALVTRVEPDGPADRAGIKPGWILRRIGNFEPTRFKKGLEDESKKGEFLAWKTASRKLSGAPGSKVKLEFVDGANREVNVNLTLGETAGTAVQFGSLPVLYADLTSKRIEEGKASIGLIRFNIWMVPTALAFNRAIEEHRGADGLIIDLRGNVGGMVGMLIGTAGHFVAEPVSLGTLVMRDNRLNLFANPRTVNAAGERVEPFSGPVAILVDEITASASEVFAGGLQDLGRARVFGRSTAGQALPAMHKELPNGDYLYHPIADFIPPKGRRFEGEGVIPDTRVNLRRETLLQGRDAAMEAAKKWIQAQSAGRL